MTEEEADKQHHRDKLLAHYQHGLDRELGTFKDVLDQRRDVRTNKVRQAEKSFDATIQYGQAVLRGAFLLNGGAAVGTASLLAHAIQYSKSNLQLAILWSLAFFVAGALLPVVAAGVSYLAQFNYTMVNFHVVMQDAPSTQPPTELARGNRWQRVAVALIVADAVIFVIGSGVGFYLLQLVIRSPTLT